MRRGSVRIAGAVAVVTGAGGGIGRATASALAARGAQVACGDLDQRAADETAEACGGLALQVDVADRASVRDFAELVHKELGAPSIIVNNAGVGLSGRFLDTTPDDWDWILGVNLRGVVEVCRTFGPALLEQGHGHVVNVSSGLAYTPRPTESAYVSSKAAILAFSQCLRADWADHGVGVSVICPGIVNTGILDRTRFRGPSAGAERVRRLRRLFARGHRPEVVASAILDAVERNRSLVPVGADAWAGWMIHRLVPSPGLARLARLTFRGI